MLRQKADRRSFCGHTSVNGGILQFVEMEICLADRLSEYIIDCLAAADGGPMAVAELKRRLAMTIAGDEAFRAAINQLISTDMLLPVDAGKSVRLPINADSLLGIFHSTSRGFGFVVPVKVDQLGDLFIPAPDTLEALNGDMVIARIMATDKSGAEKRRRVGRIVRIIRRGTSRCVGTLKRDLQGWVVMPDGSTFKQPILVQDAGAKNAAEGDKVTVELVEYPTAGQPAHGVITEVLGPHGQPDVELASVLRQFDLPSEFPPAVVDQARSAAGSFSAHSALADGARREDIRHLLTLTIDPDDARDFDDAITLRVLDQPETPEEHIEHLLSPAEADRPGPALYELGVHIADVSHFVPVDSALDLQARLRGNSVYFPRHVVPMLPEILSNGVCSLQENQPRLTKSAFIRYDRQGRVVSYRVANTLIQSDRRLTYKQAQAIIDDMKGDSAPYSKGLLDSPPNPHVPHANPEMRELLLNMDRLARAIQRRRLDQGMIVLDLPEVELVMDHDGYVKDAHPEDDSFTHKIIEMFMVEANEAVARFLTENGRSVLRRIHPDPDMDAAEQVRHFVQVAGKQLPARIDRHVIQELLDSVRGTPIAYAVHLSILKTFSTAEYSPLPLGHYALASENYAHFTSPIRRYADLVIHRSLNSVLTSSRKKSRPGKKAPPPPSLEQAGIVDLSPEVFALMPRQLGDTPDDAMLTRLAGHLSFTERRAQDAERELRSVKVLQLLAEHIGDVIDGVVTGVNSFGVFVQSTRFLVEGMIRIADLPDDFWIFDDRSASLRGQRSGRRICLGDAAKVQIVSVNIPARKMDLRILEHSSTIRGQKALTRFEPARRPKNQQWESAVGKRRSKQPHQRGQGHKSENTASDQQRAKRTERKRKDRRIRRRRR